MEVNFQANDQKKEAQNSDQLNTSFDTPKDNKNNNLIILLVAGILLLAIMATAWFIFQKKSSKEMATENPTENSKSITDNEKQQNGTDGLADTNPKNENNSQADNATNDTTMENGTDTANGAPTNEEDYIMDDDSDELSNYEEKVLGTNPKLADTDGDSYLDSAEVKGGYNPLGAGQSEIFSETGVCQRMYQDLIDKYGHSYADCYGEVGTASCKETNTKSDIVLVLDASGSMAAKIQGKTKNDIAKEASATFVRSLDESNRLGIIMYGHKGNNQLSGKNESCNGIEEVYKLASVDKDKAVGITNTLKAVGYTPIAKSLEKIKSVFATSKGTSKVAILISDGEETCGGNPAAVSKTLKDAGIKVNVIGFDVGGSAEEQLKQIAVNTDGSYYSARNLEELNQSLANLSKITCSQKANAWNEGLDSSLEKSNACFQKINEEAVNVEVKATTEMHLDFCLDYVLTKYREREKSINDQIERASDESINAVDKLDPAFDYTNDNE